MTEFVIVKNPNEINLDKDWVNAADFKSKIVDEKGALISADFAGRKYASIAKKERALTTCERAIRILIVAMAVICTLGAILLILSVREFIAQKKESKEFAMQITMPLVKENPASSSEDAKSTSKPDSKLNAANRKMDPAQLRLKELFQQITPANIQEMLDLSDRIVHLGDSAKIEPNFLQIRRTNENFYTFKLNHKDKDWPERSPYPVPEQMVQVMDNKFFYHNYKKDKTQSFENFDQCLQYFFQGFHYDVHAPGNAIGIAQINPATLIIATKKEGLVAYKNPFCAVDTMVRYGIHPSDCDCEQKRPKG